MTDHGKPGLADAGPPRAKSAPQFQLPVAFLDLILLLLLGLLIQQPEFIEGRRLPEILSENGKSAQ